MEKKKLSLRDLEKDTSWEEAVIVFTKDSFETEYTEIERSYKVLRVNKYFDSSMNGNSLLGDCLDGKDYAVRLDLYMSLPPSEGKSWEVEYCYIIE